jgi:hypothetical protein
MVRITLFTTLACKSISKLCSHIVKTAQLTFISVAMTVLSTVTPNNAGAKNVGAASGAQFITGGCANTGSGAGVCSAEAAALQNGKTGCGFVDSNSAATIAAAKAQVAKQGF